MLENILDLLPADIGVDPAYRHRAKVALPGAPIAAPGAFFKWYDLHEEGREIPAEIASSARGCVASGRTGAPGLGFVILHRCGESFYFLLVSSWRNENELWETVYYRDAGMSDFAPFPREGSHKPTFCVWELGPVGHEQLAWQRFLSSGRGAADAEAWRGDQLSGTV
jgi:hypothetical protein